MNKELLTKIVNFITPWVGSVLEGGVLLKRRTENGTEWKTENEMKVSKENKISI